MCVSFTDDHNLIRGLSGEADSVYSPAVSPTKHSLEHTTSLIEAHDRGIAERRVSVLVETTPPLVLPGESRIQIRVFIQYGRKAEKSWRLEKNESLHRQEADQVRARIEAIRL